MADGRTDLVVNGGLMRMSTFMVGPAPHVYRTSLSSYVTARERRYSRF